MKNKEGENLQYTSGCNPDAGTEKMDVLNVCICTVPIVGRHKEYEEYFQRNANTAYSNLMAEFADGTNSLIKPDDAF